MITSTNSGRTKQNRRVFDTPFDTPSLFSSAADPPTSFPESLVFGHRLSDDGSFWSHNFSDSATESTPDDDFDNNPYALFRTNPASKLIEQLPVPELRRRLEDAVDKVQRYAQHIQAQSAELERKRQVIVQLQNSAKVEEEELATLRKQNQEWESKHQKLLQEVETQRVQSELREREIQHLRYELSLYGADSLTSDTRNLYDYYSEQYRYVGYIDEANMFTAERTHHMTAADYRRMLDKQSNTDWEAFVKRVIHETDQQASIFLQQMVKNATSEQKEAIFQVILKHSYALMVNRFGNFLVQRLFENGTWEQIEKLAQSMQGRILALSREPFGCHVVQKAFDYVSEAIKFGFVQELLESIPKTLTHRYACHVWQKLFETRWSTRPGIMEHVHRKLKGQWSQIALDETGSLVIQNIFENLPEPEKRPVIEEVLSQMTAIAKGQWGNWVVQHVMEHGEQEKDRERAFDGVLEDAVQLSMDQYASKVVEKALRIGGETFLAKFIDRISTLRCSHRPRVALIDIASDQYGNYVVQWLMNNASDTQKLTISRLIKRHMVSLRGSKYGQRVAALVEKNLKNHQITTYPSSSSSYQ